jgi:protein gp37
LRYGQTKKPWTALNAAENVLLKPHKLREPLSNAKAWRGLDAAAAAAGKKDGKLVFVNSTSDLFHEQIPDEYVADVFAVMAMAGRHTFQVLTKRPERARQLLTDPPWWAKVGDAIYVRDGDPDVASVLWATHGTATWLANLWLGVSIENRKWVGRADVLREVPAAVRFISAEPLLGPLTDCRCGHAALDHGSRSGLCGAEACQCEGVHGSLDLFGIDWLIVGGESGSGHRPFDLAWARDLRDACAASGTAFFLKQAGGARPGTKLEDLPGDLRIREFPSLTAVS